MINKKLFISHSREDQALADSLCELLKEGLELKTHEMACHSLEEQGIAGGRDFFANFQTQLGEPEVAVVLLSKNYLTSRFCLCELGVCMATARKVIPLLVAPLKGQHVKELIDPARLLQAEDTDDLNKLATQLQESLPGVELVLHRWSVQKKRFLSNFRS